MATQHLLLQEMQSFQGSQQHQESREAMAQAQHLESEEQTFSHPSSMEVEVEAVHLDQFLALEAMEEDLSQLHQASSSTALTVCMELEEVELLDREEQ